jgi:mRNA interferase MazF
VSKRTFHPGRGDLIEMNFQPAAGREIDRRRPAIVLSPITYNRSTGLCLAVPISTDDAGATLDPHAGGLSRPPEPHPL